MQDMNSRMLRTDSFGMINGCEEPSGNLLTANRVIVGWRSRNELRQITAKSTWWLKTWPISRVFSDGKWTDWSNVWSSFVPVIFKTWSDGHRDKKPLTRACILSSITFHSWLSASCSPENRKPPPRREMSWVNWNSTSWRLLSTVGSSDSKYKCLKAGETTCKLCICGNSPFRRIWAICKSGYKSDSFLTRGSPLRSMTSFKSDRICDNEGSHSCCCCVVLAWGWWKYNRSDWTTELV